MSKIAEQKAKEIAKNLERVWNVSLDNFSVVCGAIEGYDQAMQDFLEKAKEFFIEQHAGMFTQFKNYMQDESN